MAILSKGCKPDNFESYTPLKLRFTNIWGLCSNFVDCESFLESNFPDILTLCETNLYDSIGSSNFSVRSYLSLIQKDSAKFMWRKDFPLHVTYLQKMLQILTYILNWLYFTQYVTSFSSIDDFLCLYAQFLILFHLT